MSTGTGKNNAYVEYFNPDTQLTLRVSPTREGLKLLGKHLGLKQKREYRFQPGQAASKRLSLYVRAYREGKWVSGAILAREEVVSRAREYVTTLTVADLANLTEKGRAALGEIYQWTSSASSVSASVGCRPL